MVGNTVATTSSSLGAATPGLISGPTGGPIQEQRDTVRDSRAQRRTTFFFLSNLHPVPGEVGLGPRKVWFIRKSCQPGLAYAGRIDPRGGLGESPAAGALGRLQVLAKSPVTTGQPGSPAGPRGHPPRLAGPSKNFEPGGDGRPGAGSIRPAPHPAPPGPGSHRPSRKTGHPRSPAGRPGEIPQGGAAGPPSPGPRSRRWAR